MIQQRRSLLLKILESLELKSSNQNEGLIVAINFLLKNTYKRSKYLPDDVDLSFTTSYWRKKIISSKKNGKTMHRRRELESCILEYASKELNSGDLFVKGGTNYADYRAELMPWEECQKHLNKMCEQSDLDNNSEAMFTHLKTLVIDKAKK